MTVEKICFLVNYNLYESKRHFTQKLAEALNQQDVETLIIDLKEEPFGTDTAAAIHNFSPDLTASFNSIPPLPSGKFLWDILKIPHLSLLVDSAMYSLDLIKSPYSIVSCVDKFECQTFIDKGFEKTFFLPHATDSNIEANTGERPYDVVFIGSCYDFESVRASWKEKFSLQLENVLLVATKIVLSDSFTPINMALQTALKQAQITVNESDFQKLFYDLDIYIRGLDRVSLIRSITDTAVTVYGDIMTDDDRFQNDWRYYFSDKPNITVHAGVPFSTSLEILQLSKICLNSVPSFKNGSHERIFNSFACGALPISSPSIYLQESFVTDKEIAFYQFGKWKEINSTLDHYLFHETERLKAVQAGRAKVMQQHTWDARAKTLLEVLDSANQLIAAWQKVWQSNIPRSYTTDL